MLSTVVTAVVALAGVLLGGWVTTRNQNRLWQLDHARHWRDVRMRAFADFLAAYREYLAYVLDPAAQITTRVNPNAPDRLMPFFGESGRPYKERLEATSTAVRLVAEDSATVRAAHQLVMHVRKVAAARAEHAESDLPPEIWPALWEAQNQFMAKARRELGLSEARDH